MLQQEIDILLVAMTSVEMEIEEAINKLKQSIPPARPCLLKFMLKHRIKATGF